MAPVNPDCPAAGPAWQHGQPLCERSPAAAASDREPAVDLYAGTTDGPPGAASAASVTARRALARQRQIDIGKARPEYLRYVKEVSKERRLPSQPQTPDPHASVSKRQFDRQLSEWRRLLHEYDDPPAVPLGAVGPPAGGGTVSSTGWPPVFSGGFGVHQPPGPVAAAATLLGRAPASPPPGLEAYSDFRVHWGSTRAGSRLHPWQHLTEVTAAPASTGDAAAAVVAATGSPPSLLPLLSEGGASELAWKRLPMKVRLSEAREGLFAFEGT